MIRDLKRNEFEQYAPFFFKYASNKKNACFPIYQANQFDKFLEYEKNFVNSNENILVYESQNHIYAWIHYIFDLDNKIINIESCYIKKFYSLIWKELEEYFFKHFGKVSVYISIMNGNIKLSQLLEENDFGLLEMVKHYEINDYQSLEYKRHKLHNVSFDDLEWFNDLFKTEEDDLDFEYILNHQDIFKTFYYEIGDREEMGMVILLINKDINVISMKSNLGLSSKMLEILLSKVFEEANNHDKTISLDVKDDDKRFLKLGFTYTGLIKRFKKVINFE